MKWRGHVYILPEWETLELLELDTDHALCTHQEAKIRHVMQMALEEDDFIFGRNPMLCIGRSEMYSSTKSLTTFQDLPYDENMSKYGAEIRERLLKTPGQILRSCHCSYSDQCLVKAENTSSQTVQLHSSFVPQLLYPPFIYQTAPLQKEMCKANCLLFMDCCWHLWKFYFQSEKISVLPRIINFWKFNR